MELSKILDRHFPGMANVGYEVEQGAGGDIFISWWDEDIMGRAQPTPAEIESARLPALKADKRIELILAANEDYKAIFTRDGNYIELEKDYLFLRAIMGLTLSLVQINQRTQMRNVIEKLQQKLQEVSAAGTEADVNAVTW